MKDGQFHKEPEFTAGSDVVVPPQEPEQAEETVRLDP
jgi:hypothetical protein